jgi:hypothetical protein
MAMTENGAAATGAAANPESASGVAAGASVALDIGEGFGALPRP